MAANPDLTALALMPAGDMARSWRCPRCQVDFPLDVAVCGGCGTSSRHPEAFLPPPRNAGTTVGLKVVAWRCRQCRRQNGIDVAQCAGCGADKPALPNSARRKPEAPPAVCNVFSWRCVACERENSVMAESCEGCSEEAPFLPERKEEEKQEKKANEEKKKKKKRKKLEAWVCGSCCSTQPLGHLRCSRCGHNVPRLPDTAALRQVKREVEKLCQLTEDLQLKAPEKQFECPVCLETAEAPLGCRLRLCGHDLCRSCLAALVGHSDGRIISCPACPSPVDNRDARNSVSCEVWERHVRLCLRRQAAARPYSFSCSVVDCNGRLQLDAGASGGTASCPECRQDHCTVCRAVHTGRSCEEHREEEQKRLADDVTESQFEELKKRGVAMHCPACSAFLEKIYGCDWMQCPVCDTEVCWATKGPRWGPKGRGDITGGCRCRVNGVPCVPNCTTCHSLLPNGLE